jgi:hypothetical protein
MDRKTLEKHEETMALLMKMETEIVLGNMLVLHLASGTFIHL